MDVWRVEGGRDTSEGGGERVLRRLEENARGFTEKTW
jgi:hypothetical protein